MMRTVLCKAALLVLLLVPAACFGSMESQKYKIEGDRIVGLDQVDDELTTTSVPESATKKEIVVRTTASLGLLISAVLLPGYKTYAKKRRKNKPHTE